MEYGLTGISNTYEFNYNVCIGPICVHLQIISSSKAKNTSDSIEIARVKVLV